MPRNAMSGRRTQSQQKKRDEIEAAIDAVIEAQGAFWDALSVLEERMGIDIDDSSFNFEGETVESLKERFS